MKWPIIAGLVLILAGCATHELRCNSVLRPINTSPPTAVANAVTVPPR